jgi:Domain of unknown function (DUF6434)
MTQKFDWLCGRITTTTPVTADYRGTQNVRRFMRSQCGEAFTFDRDFMHWIKDGAPKTMGDVVQEWIRRHRAVDREAH